MDDLISSAVRAAVKRTAAGKARIVRQYAQAQARLAKQDPLNGAVVFTAVQSRGFADGYEQACADIMAMFEPQAEAQPAPAKAPPEPAKEPEKPFEGSAKDTKWVGKPDPNVVVTLEDLAKEG